MAGLAVRLLGTFQVMQGEQPITGFESDKVRALLAYLAVESGSPHRRESLAGLLWSESTDRAARTNLRHVLADLRQTINDHEASPPFLHITRQTIQFNTESDYELDVTRFGLLSQIHTTTAACVAQWQDAAILYQGPFLPDFSLPGSPAFEEWLLLHRERLAHEMLALLQRLIRHYEAGGDYAEALTYAWQLVELEPWLEEGHQHLMRLLALTGQRSLALAQYQTCRRLLAESVQAEPAPETVNLYRRILSGVLGQPTEHQRKRKTQPFSPQPYNLPVQLTPFIGREEEVAQIVARLLDPDCRLLTLVGAGGSGKTRIAVAATQQLFTDPPAASIFPEGIYFVPLVALNSRDSLISAIARGLDYTFYHGPDPKIQLLDLIREKRLLLLLDNFEHLLEGTSLITEILLAAPGVKVLVTSRLALDLYEEWLYPVAGMPIFAPAHSPEQTTGSLPEADVGKQAGSALQLFAHCARHVRPDYDLTLEREPAIRICRLVEGLPLGIELAAAWLNVLPAQKIAQEIERSFDFLTGRQHDMPERHQSMRAVFEQSWQLLSQVEQQVLRCLSVFRGDFLPEAVQAIIPDATLEILAGLIEKSLFTLTGEGRYHIHELLRQFATEKSRAEPAEQAETQDRHRRYFLAFLHQQENILRGQGQKEALTAISREIENIRVAWNRAVDQQVVAEVDEALGCLYNFYYTRSRYQEGEEVFKYAIDHLPHRRYWANFWLAMAHFAWL